MIALPDPNLAHPAKGVPLFRRLPGRRALGVQELARIDRELMMRVDIAHTLRQVVAGRGRDMAHLEIDGAMGEGGGQVVRTSLALAALTRQPFVMERIRAGRRKPGLMRQHLTAVRAAAAICDARVDGDELGSQRLRFEPSAVRPGHHRFSVGTAGSACLVLQTVLPPLLTADAPSRLVLEGGTHNPWAPPFDFLRLTFLPLLARMGAKVTVGLERHGFYPAGGGRFSVVIEPVESLAPLHLRERGAVVAKGGRILIANLPQKIAQREVDQLARRLGWPASDFDIVEVRDSVGPGNVVFVHVESEAVTELFTGFGQKGVSVAQVVEPMVKDVRAYLASEAPAGMHLADQLLLPMAMAGAGSLGTVGLSRHTVTNIDVIRTFLNTPIRSERRERGDVLIELG